MKNKSRTGRSFAPSPAVIAARRDVVVRSVPDPVLVRAATEICMTERVYRPGSLPKGQDWHQVRDKRNGRITVGTSTT